MSRQQDDQGTRRGLLRATLTLVGAAAVVPARAQEKVAQSVVQYQGQPKNGQMCSSCANFAPPNACKIVAGTVSPNGWCLVYAPKT